MRISWPIDFYLSNHQNTTKTNLVPSSSSLPLYFSLFFVGIAWTVGDDEALERQSRIEHAIATACRDGVSPERVGFWVFKRPCQRVLRFALLVRLLQRRVLHIVLIA